ncbi:MAG: hypothetical protein JWO59_1063 [Chloroflexi bacterium]|nr:hypothetical protein [Chloroflexota bacterium]
MWRIPDSAPSHASHVAGCNPDVDFRSNGTPLNLLPADVAIRTLFQPPCSRTSRGRFKLDEVAFEVDQRRQPGGRLDVNGTPDIERVVPRNVRFDRCTVDMRKSAIHEWRACVSQMERKK